MSEVINHSLIDWFHFTPSWSCWVSPAFPLCWQNKYKEQSKKQLPHGSFTTLPETRDTVHVKEVTKNVSEVSSDSAHHPQNWVFLIPTPKAAAYKFWEWGDFFIHLQQFQGGFFQVSVAFLSCDIKNSHVALVVLGRQTTKRSLWRRKANPTILSCWSLLRWNMLWKLLKTRAQ